MNRFVKHLLISLLIAFGPAILLLILMFTGPAMMVLVPALLIPLPLTLWYYGMSDAKSVGEGIGFSMIYFFSWLIGSVILYFTNYPWIGFGGYQYIVYQFSSMFSNVSFYDTSSWILPLCLVVFGLLLGIGIYGAMCGLINKKKAN